MTKKLPAAVATRLEKVAVDNGFDLQMQREGSWLGFASTQAPLRIWLTAPDELLCVAALSMAHVAAGLEEFGDSVDAPLPDGAVAARTVTGFAELHRLVRRAFQLSRTLPDALLQRFELQTAGLPRATEVERLVVQRVGQEVFRQGLLEFWQGRCAVTGLAIPELLRASHIKPWAACEGDAERLDVFNGLLLAPHLDAAFDRGFISIAGDGAIVRSPQLGEDDRLALGLSEPLRVRSLSSQHERYLEFHRANVFKRSAPGRVGHPTVCERAQRSTGTVVPMFERYVGVDYSGAQASGSSLNGLRVFWAHRGVPPREEPSDRRKWTRRELAEWLVCILSDPAPTVIGIDHAFSFPLAYFERHHVARSWDAFLDDFVEHWPTDRDGVWVRDLRNNPASSAVARRGETTWRRLCERWTGAAKSVFQFGVQGEVATSTHAGLPWLRRIRRTLGDRVHFWPFDGWSIPSGKSTIVEVYPSLWRTTYACSGFTGDQRDAYAVAAWLHDADQRGTLKVELSPDLQDSERTTAAIEGWILGTPLGTR